MIEPLLSLSFSLHSNKGVYALLLGSGLSRTAQIPTGWEVLEDLIRQLAILKDEKIEGDPAEWYEKQFSEKPDYSKVLDAIAKTPAERSKLLRKYFEPTTEQRENGEKVPTAAHKAIAQLVATGYIKVIVTTNFDRLIESALEEVGISPVVISTPDAIKGAPPLAHSTCTVIKLHGDYIDTRIRNTTGELEKYDSATNQLLDQILDEYGLIISGWSGDWDTALKAAIERCKSNRFTTYWTTRSKLSDSAAKLAELRKAQIIKISGADEFFTELEQKIMALEEYDRPHPLSVKTAVVQLKRNITDDRYRIQLHDLLTEETEKLWQTLNNDYSTQVASIDAEYLYQRLKKYEAAVETLQALLVNGSYFGEPKHTALWAKSLSRIASQKESNAGSVALIDLKRYPSFLLLYSAGIAAIDAGRYYNLNALFDVMDTEPQHDPVSILTKANAWAVSGNDGNAMTKQERKYTPLSEHAFGVLRPSLSEVIPDDSNYDEAFDRLEILIAMKVASMAITNGRENPWIPTGRFAWKHKQRGVSAVNTVGQEMSDAGANWLPLKAGMFKGLADANASFEAVKAFVDKLSWF